MAKQLIVSKKAAKKPARNPKCVDCEERFEADAPKALTKAAGDDENVCPDCNKLRRKAAKAAAAEAANKKTKKNDKQSGKKVAAPAEPRIPRSTGTGYHVRKRLDSKQREFFVITHDVKQGKGKNAEVVEEDVEKFTSKNHDNPMNAARIELRRMLKANA